MAVEGGQRASEEINEMIVDRRLAAGREDMAMEDEVERSSWRRRLEALYSDDGGRRGQLPPVEASGAPKPLIHIAGWAVELHSMSRARRLGRAGSAGTSRAPQSRRYSGSRRG